MAQRVRCHVCRLDVTRAEPERGTHVRGGTCRLDSLCNSFVNPPRAERTGTTWRAREAVLRAVWRANRTEPGWGDMTRERIGAQYARSLRNYYSTESARIG